MKDPNQNLENSVASKNIDNLYQEIENLNKVNSELNEKIKNLELLVQLNYNLNHTLEKTEILNSVKDFFSTYFYIDEYSLMLKTDSEDKLELVSSLGLQKPNIWAPITRKKSVLNRAFHQNEIVYVPDIASTNPEIIKELGCKQCGSLLTIPLLPEPGTYYWSVKSASLREKCVSRAGNRAVKTDFSPNFSSYRPNNTVPKLSGTCL